MRTALKSHLKALREAIAEGTIHDRPWAPELQALHDRLDPRPENTERRAYPEPSQVEAALLRTANGKVVPITNGEEGFWIAQRYRIRKLRVTVETAEAVGRWLARQGWLNSPVTIDTVLRKWVDWSSRAQGDKANVARTQATLEDLT